MKILCYRCGEYGYSGRGWAHSSYRTKGKAKAKARRRYGRYHTRYIRHYDSEKYHKQMERYRTHEIKSRPNGQKRCHVSRGVQFYSNGEYGVAFNYYHIPRDCFWPNLIELEIQRKAKVIC
jgi:hypothetical protein